MANFKNYWRFALLLCMAVCLCVGLAACGNGNNTTESTQATTVGTSTYTVKVSTASGIQLSGLSVYVYTDATLNELETMKQLDENGCASFTATTSGDYVAVLMGVPVGYDLQEYYAFDSKNEANIVLTSSVITNAQKPENKVYGLGDVMYDFSITASDGTVYTLSELLQQKDAVVLNFWYLNCSPCMMEFPYLEMAYKEYSDRLELLAINCEDGNDAELNAFKAENDFTFPAAIGEKSYWYQAAYYACPTTIVVDRYGMIVYMHTGYFDEVAPFNALFRTVTGQDYTPTLIHDVESLITEDDYRDDGSQERPYSLGGVQEFDVKIPANGKVYYNLYRLDGVTLHIENANAYLIVDGEYHYPENGVIEVTVRCEDTFTPVNVAFCNTSSTQNELHVQLMFAPGNINNPFALVLGDNEVTVTELGGLGLYYTYTASASGTLSLTVQSCTEGATPDIHLYNKNTEASVYFTSDGVTDAETGLTTVSIQVNAGDEIQIIIGAAVPQDSGITSVTILALASLTEGGGSGVINDGKTGYSVSVVDQNGQPMSGVNLILSIGTGTRTLTTDDNGYASIRLTAGAYPLELKEPDGYSADTTAYLLSPGVTSLVITVREQMPYSVQILKDDGTPVYGLPVQVYKYSAADKLLYALQTDAEGCITFTGVVTGVYYLVFEAPEAYYHVEAYYIITESQTQIILEKVEITSAYRPGDQMEDFTVISIDGVSYNLSEILGEKEVVILTFWKSNSIHNALHLTCLQRAYDQFGDKMEVLAMNPVDGTDADLQLVRNMYDLTFPMIRCDGTWVKKLELNEYPTTVIIDREGKVCLIHAGQITEVSIYDRIVELFTAEDYIHTVYPDLDALMDGQNNRRKVEE